VCTPTPRIHGYDFTDQGMISIWEGFQPSQIPDIETTPPVLQREFLPSDFSSSAHLDRHGTWPSTADGLQGNFQAALKELAVRKLGDNLDWKPVVSTSKTEARRVALLLCGWPLEDDEFTRTIKGFVGAHFRWRELISRKFWIDGKRRANNHGRLAGSSSQNTMKKLWNS